MLAATPRTTFAGESKLESKRAMLQHFRSQDCDGFRILYRRAELSKLELNSKHTFNAFGTRCDASAFALGAALIALSFLLAYSVSTLVATVPAAPVLLPALGGRGRHILSFPACARIGQCRDLDLRMGRITRARHRECGVGMQADNIHIRPAVDSDLPAIKDIWRDALGPNVFGGKNVFDAYIDWAMSRNPHTRLGTPAQWVAEKDGQVLGVYTTSHVRLFVQGTPRDAIWLQQTAVSTNAQRMGIGRRIYRTIVAANNVTLGVGVTKASLALYRSEGVQFVPADQLFSRPVSFRIAARKLLADVFRRRFSSALPALDRWRSGASGMLPTGIYP